MGAASALPPMLAYALARTMKIGVVASKLAINWTYRAQPPWRYSQFRELHLQ
jgi:hypothetical protein